MTIRREIAEPHRETSAEPRGLAPPSSAVPVPLLLLRRGQAPKRRAPFPNKQCRSKNLPTPYTLLKGRGRGCPLLHASKDIHAPSKHAFSLFRDGGWLIFHCARPTRGVRDRALREHRRSSGSIPAPFWSILLEHTSFCPFCQLSAIVVADMKSCRLSLITSARYG